ncbi:hypothetical protein PHMEG_00019449, partial [Phytophthora megakarya]
VDAENVEGRWKIVHLKGSNYHNYPPSHDPSFYPGHRRSDMERLTNSDVSTGDLIAAQTAVSVSPQVVVAKIRRSDPASSITAQAISNRKDAERLETAQFTELYHMAANPSTETELNDTCAMLRSTNAELPDYLDLRWWKYKTNVVRCWTSQYLHFGHRDTSPVEVTHTKCKKGWEISQGDLLTCFSKLLP